MLQLPDMLFTMYSMAMGGQALSNVVTKLDILYIREISKGI